MVSQTEPYFKKKKLVAKDYGPKTLDQEIKLDIPLLVQKEKQGTPPKDVDSGLQKESTLMNLVMEATRSQENCWKWVGKENDTLKEDIKEIIDIFTDSPKPNKMEKLMIMT